MDRRRRPMTPLEEVAARDALDRTLAAHPEWDVATVLRTVRASLHLTLVDMARVGRVSVPTLKNIEARRGSPTLQSVERLLRPFGYRLAVVRAVSSVDAAVPRPVIAKSDPALP